MALCGISGSHGGKYEDGCLYLLGCCAVQSDRIFPTFQRDLLPPPLQLHGTITRRQQSSENDNSPNVSSICLRVFMFNNSNRIP
jgi:hypothetical protein